MIILLYLYLYLYLTHTSKLLLYDEDSAYKYLIMIL